MRSVAQEHVRDHETRRRISQRFSMDTLTDMQFDVVKCNPCLCKHASKDIRPFYFGDDFVILADENVIRSGFAERIA